MERLAFTHESRRPIHSILITNVHVYATRLPDQRYGYKLQDIRELGGRYYVTLWVPDETVSRPVCALWSRSRYNLLNRLRLNVTYLQTLVGHKSD